MIKSILIALTLLLTPALAQEHKHGENVPDWYETNCCNLNDCHPVEDKTITFGRDEVGQPWVVHTPDDNTPPISYERSRWRTSQDERFHACYHPITKTPYCVYLRSGV